MHDEQVRVEFSGVSQAEASQLADSLRQHLADHLRAEGAPVAVSLERSDPRSQNLGDIVLLAASTSHEHLAEIAKGLPGHVAGGLLAHFAVHVLAKWWEARGRPSLKVKSFTADQEFSMNSGTNDAEKALREFLKKLASS